MVLKKVFIWLMVVMVPCGAARARVRRDPFTYGRHIAWSIEESSGGAWYALNTSAEDTWTAAHCELEGVMPKAAFCSQPGYGGHYSGSWPFESRAYRVRPTMGRAYRVAVRNLTSCRMSVTLGVDGVNSIDSRTVFGRSTDPGWVLNGYDTIYVKGFQADSDSAMEFYWTDPWNAHSDRRDELGAIHLYVYFEDTACAREHLWQTRCPQDQPGRILERKGNSDMGTGAGNEVYNPVRKVLFNDLTQYPLEIVKVAYSDRVHAAAPRPDLSCGSPYSPPSPAPTTGSCYTGIGVKVRANSYSGVEVLDVFTGSSAWHAGIRAGDTLVKANGAILHEIGDLVNLVRGMSSGDVVDLRYLHNGRSLQARVQLSTVCP